jgi:hypothetical protein
MKHQLRSLNEKRRAQLNVLQGHQADGESRLIVKEDQERLADQDQEIERVGPQKAAERPTVSI